MDDRQNAVFFAHAHEDLREEGQLDPLLLLLGVRPFCHKAKRLKLRYIAHRYAQFTTHKLNKK